jgi:hypothetical protein
MRSRTPN